MTIKPMLSQIRTVLYVFTTTYLPAVLLLLIMILVSLITDIPIAHFVRDTADIANVAFYTGAISNIGIMLWSASASICLFTYTVLRIIDPDSKMIYFFLSAGFFTLVLLFDDAFQFHEWIAPIYIGLPSTIVFIFYGLISLIFFVNFKNIIFKSDYVLFFISIGFFTASIIFDKIHDFRLFYILNIDSSGMKFLLEDGCKLMGIAGWFGYFTLTCFGTFVKKETENVI